jgi:multidrug transporter EmrE-like cation transporter
MSYIDILGISFSEIIGDFGFKEFANKGGIRPFAVGATGYVGVIYFLIRALQGSTILTVNSAWDGTSALIESLAAYILLGERFDDPFKYVGIAFIVIGLFFLRMPVMKEHTFVFPNLFH